MEEKGSSVFNWFSSERIKVPFLCHLRISSEEPNSALKMVYFERKPLKGPSSFGHLTYLRGKYFFPSGLNIVTPFKQFYIYCISIVCWLASIYLGIYVGSRWIQPEQYWIVSLSVENIGPLIWVVDVADLDQY